MILDKIIGALAAPIFGKLTDSVTDIAKSYFNKEISEAEFKSRTDIAVQDAFKAVEKAWAEAATKQFAEFQQTVRATPVVARAYAIVIVTQLFVLLWYQWGASAFKLVTGVNWPSPGTTVDWAYAILALCLGGGAFAMRGQSVQK